MKEGDKNTKFFHRCANARKAANTIRSIVVDGCRVVDKNGTREAVRNHFSIIFWFLFEHSRPSSSLPASSPATPPSGSLLVASGSGTIFPSFVFLYFDLFLHRRRGVFSKLAFQVVGFEDQVPSSRCGSGIIIDRPSLFFNIRMHMRSSLSPLELRPTAAGCSRLFSTTTDRITTITLNVIFLLWSLGTTSCGFSSMTEPHA